MVRWPEYEPVAVRKLRNKKEQARLKRQGHELQPVEIAGRLIANTFWGRAWCDHLEKFSDYSNRLPRGRSYVRNGSVCDLKISQGAIKAQVSGSELYHATVHIDPLPALAWQDIKSECAGGIASVLELLQGKLSSSVMNVVTDRHTGLFPDQSEISLSCDCPDHAYLCKHLAAVLYGIGARLDKSPELLFILRGVDYNELIESKNSLALPDSTGVEVRGDLADIFGIELDDAPPDPSAATEAKSKRKVSAKKASKKTKAKVKVQGKSDAKRKVRKKATGKVKSKSPTANYNAKVGVVNTGAQKPDKRIDISRGIRASHLKSLRKQHSLSIAQLAKVTGKSVQTITKWEATTGVLNLQSHSAAVLERVFALSPRQLSKEL